MNVTFSKYFFAASAFRWNGRKLISGVIDQGLRKNIYEPKEDKVKE
jgi:hypothetical protein